MRSLHSPISSVTTCNAMTRSSGGKRASKAASASAVHNTAFGRVDPTVLDPSVYLLDKSAVQATGLLICRFFYFRSANGALPAR